MAVSKPIRVPASLILSTRLLIHFVCIAYLSYTLFLGINGGLEGDPVQYLLDFTGIGAVNLLFLSLLISPIAEYAKFGQIIRLRKTLGVYSAIYALSHLFVFIAFELQFEWSLIASEIIKRPYITVGFAGLLILCALLVTSFDRVKRKMGSTWSRLHRLVYLAVLLITLHYLWSIKANELQPVVYAVFAAILLILRRKKLVRFRK